MISKLADYHSLIISVEKAVVAVYDEIDNSTIDFEKIAWVRTLAHYMPIREVHQNLAVWPIAVYFLSATFCLGCSAIFHWFYVKSPWVYKILHRMDLTGIVVLIFGSVVPVIFYS